MNQNYNDTGKLPEIPNKTPKIDPNFTVKSPSANNRRTTPIKSNNQKSRHSGQSLGNPKAMKTIDVYNRRVSTDKILLGQQGAISFNFDDDYSFLTQKELCVRIKKLQELWNNDKELIEVLRRKLETQKAELTEKQREFQALHRNYVGLSKLKVSLYIYIYI